MLDSVKERGATTETGRPSCGAGLPDVHETSLKAMTEALRKHLGALVVDEPAVQAASV